MNATRLLRRDVPTVREMMVRRAIARHEPVVLRGVAIVHRRAIGVETKLDLVPDKPGPGQPRLPITIVRTQKIRDATQASRDLLS